MSEDEARELYGDLYRAAYKLAAGLQGFEPFPHNTRDGGHRAGCVPCRLADLRAALRALQSHVERDLMIDRAVRTAAGERPNFERAETSWRLRATLAEIEADVLRDIGGQP